MQTGASGGLAPVCERKVLLIMVSKNSKDAKTLALDYARRGWAVFPVHYIKPNGKCSCDKSDCENSGKHPMTYNGLKDASSDPAAVEAELIAYCKTNLSSLKCPKSIDVIDQLPRHANGKLLKRMLRDPYWKQN